MAPILDAIGDTPLVRLTHCTPANGAEVWVKLEYRNPTGSMKDRMALAMIEGAEREGALEPGNTVVEYTGGSTGPVLALVCRAKGYRCLIVIADCFTEERFELVRQWGMTLDGDRVEEPAGFSQTETCLVLSLVNGSPFQPPKRSRSFIPARRAIRSSSAGQT